MKLKFKKCILIFLIVWVCGFILFVLKNYMCCINNLGRLFSERNNPAFSDDGYLDLFLDEEKEFTDVPMMLCNDTNVRF